MQKLMPLYAKASKMETKIEFVVHKTAKSVVLGFFRRDYPKIEDDKILGKKTEVKLLMGKKWKDGATVGDIVKWVQSVGIWGYCHHKGKNHKEIHYWLSSKADRYSVMEFILHEVYHAGGYSSENTACKLAGLGCFAYQVFERDFEKKLRKKRQE